MRLCALLILLLLGACASQTDVARQKYVAAWSERLAGYQDQYRRHDADLRAQIRRDSDALGMMQEVQWTDVSDVVLQAAARIREGGRIAGRGQTIRQFIQHIEGQPTLGLTDIWFQNAVSDLRARAQKADAEIRAFRDADRGRRAVPEWIADVERLSWEHGQIEGTALELQALYQQAIAFYGDQRSAQVAEAQQQQRASIALMAMGSYLNQLNYQQQMLNALNRPRTCARYANTVTCY